MPRIGIREVRLQDSVEGIRFLPALVENGVKLGERLGAAAMAQPPAQADAAAGGDRHGMIQGGARALLLGIDGSVVAVHDGVVKRVLEVTAHVGLAIEPDDIGLVVAKQQPGLAFAEQKVHPELRMPGLDGIVCGHGQLGLAAGARPRPRVAEPQLRNHVQCGRLRTAVMHRHLAEDIGRAGLGVLHEHVKVPIIVEDTGIEQLEFRVGLAAGGVALDQLRVGKGPLRILVKHLEVGMGGGGVEVIIELLDVLAVIALAVGQPEEAFLQERIDAVPQGQGKAKVLVFIADPGQAVLAPAISLAAGVVVAQVVPGIAVAAVVLADRAPLALAQVGAPLTPVLLAQAVLFQPQFLGIHVAVCFLHSAPISPHSCHEGINLLLCLCTIVMGMILL